MSSAPEEAARRPSAPADAAARRHHDNDQLLRSRALGLLFMAGATIGLTSLLLPHPAQADTVGLYSNVGLAYLGGAFLLVFARRTSPWMLHGALVVGCVLITRAVFLSGESVSFYAVWFIWVPLYAVYFFDRAAAVGYVALSSGLFGLTLAHKVPTSPVARWLTTVATLIVAGVFIDTLVRRARREAASADANASRMAKVADVALRLASLSDRKAARRALCDAAVELTGALGAVLWEQGSETAELRVFAAAGTADQSKTISVEPAVAGAAQAFTTRGAVCSRTVSPTPEAAPEFGGRSVETHACLWQAVVQDEGVIAVLALIWEDPAVLDDPSMLTICDLIVAEVKVTLERVTLLSRLESIARTDELTGLPNRRAWQETLPRELQRARRSGEPLCIAMLDLDHFKRYNDARGHQAGDRLLKEVAVSWSNELRAGDILARYGGEEFAVVLPACPLERGMGVVERLRAATPGTESCSAGLALFDGEESSSELLERADRALYEAKRTGRNRTVLGATTASHDDADGVGALSNR